MHDSSTRLRRAVVSAPRPPTVGRSAAGAGQIGDAGALPPAWESARRAPRTAPPSSPKVPAITTSVERSPGPDVSSRGESLTSPAYGLAEDGRLPTPTGALKRAPGERCQNATPENTARDAVEFQALGRSSDAERGDDGEAEPKPATETRAVDAPSPGDLARADGSRVRSHAANSRSALIASPPRG